MATDSTSSNRGVYRQSNLFLTLLILLWGLVICFVVFQYSREKEHKIELMHARLQQINLQLSQELNRSGVPNAAFGRSVRSYDGLRITLVDTTGRVLYDSDRNPDMIPNLSKNIEIERAIKSGSGLVTRSASKVNSVDSIYSATLFNDIVIRAAQPYSVSIKEVLYLGNGFLLIAIVISILISIVGYLTSKLYSKLEETTVELDREHEVALREEQEKIRIKRQLTNNINHELKTPVCSILGYLEMIINNPEIDPVMCRSFIQKSYDQADRLRSLMADLSTITRIDEASGMIEKESVALTTLIYSIMDDVMPQAEKQHIRIDNKIEQELVIEGNQMLLYSIFRNLIDNAVAYSAARCITIALLKEDDHSCLFSLKDNGIGVDEHHLPYLFERFYRVDKGRSRKIGGTGLGLSIVKNAVLFHGGTIEAKIVESGGLEFVFSLNKR